MLLRSVFSGSDAADWFLCVRDAAVDVSGCRFWIVALHWFVWSENPIEAGRKSWMYEALSVTAAHLGVLFFFVVAGLGYWIGSIWNKAKRNPSLLEAQVWISAPVRFWFAAEKVQQSKCLYT